ncbi:ABC transporter permease [Deinococcus koreensis]|uniref:ABC transporter permease n=2 Tax=Deinococcus koreensis TaxID=2054903 RepID=A0A2K3UTT3_9DEIO|nr:ABC transporter permease [Deinococcus koreensis]
MLLPVLIVVLGAVGYPLLRTLYLSFTDARLMAFTQAPPWVGLSNYAQALQSPAFQAATGRTALFVVASVGLEVLLGVLAALLLNQRFYGRALARALLIVPLALPTVVNAIMWRWIYNPEYGALNALLTQWHLLPEYRSWLGDPGSAMTMLIVADVWKNFPLVAIVALSALQLMDRALYEAADIDGAGAWTRFWRITWPGILPVLSVAIVLRTIEAVKVFDLVFVMTRGGPADSTKTLSLLVFEQGFGFLRSGVGAAYAYLVVAISAVLIALYLTLLRRQAAP